MKLERERERIFADRTNNTKIDQLKEEIQESREKEIASNN
uniref:Uncharacterized protein n=1 Tax=Nelumbo nucifera TaxID=4432 RepID=A0A822YML1_NELNU|nr:TPA_asm: hypothetical protein HUJ06_011390 [Nelumbo nucifera]